MKGVNTLAFYRICPDCGAYLDPGEQCSCHEEHMLKMDRCALQSVIAKELILIDKEAR